MTKSATSVSHSDSDSSQVSLTDGRPFRRLADHWPRPRGVVACHEKGRVGIPERKPEKRRPQLRVGTHACHRRMRTPDASGVHSGGIALGPRHKAIPSAVHLLHSCALTALALPNKTALKQPQTYPRRLCHSTHLILLTPRTGQTIRSFRGRSNKP